MVSAMGSLYRQRCCVNTAIALRLCVPSADVPGSNTELEVSFAETSFGKCSIGTACLCRQQSLAFLFLCGLDSSSVHSRVRFNCFG